MAKASAKPASGRVPLTVTFDGRQSIAGSNDISSYTWDFGDGSPLGKGSVVTHTYSTAGTYVTTLTVTDAGWAESSAQAVVTATGKR